MDAIYNGALYKLFVPLNWIESRVARSHIINKGMNLQYIGIY